MTCSTVSDHTHGSSRRVLTGVLVGALVLGACGRDDDDAAGAHKPSPWSASTRKKKLSFDCKPSNLTTIKMDPNR